MDREAIVKLFEQLGVLVAELLEKPPGDLDDTQEEYLTQQQAAAVLRVSPQTVYRLAKAGKLSRVRLTAKTVRYSRKEIESLLTNTPPK